MSIAGILFPDRNRFKFENAVSGERLWQIVSYSVLNFPDWVLFFAKRSVVRHGDYLAYTQPFSPFTLASYFLYNLFQILPVDVGSTWLLDYFVLFHFAPGEGTLTPYYIFLSIMSTPPQKKFLIF